MKVSIAVVKLVLRTNKTLADGSHPIMLRCSFNGRKEVSTSYSCPLKYWDKKNECVKKGFPNYLTINSIITKQKMEAIERRDEFEKDGIAYTPSMVLTGKEVLSVPKNDLWSLILRYKVSLSDTTFKVWKSFYNSFKGFIGKDNININEISLETIKGYSSYLEKSGMKDSTIKMTLSKLAAILKYAVEEGIINDSPFKRYNYGKKYKTSAKLLYIDKDAMEIMKEMLLEKLIKRTSKTRWTYKDDVYNEFVDKKSELFVLVFYLFGYVFQGLSPIDLCQLRVKDMSIIEKDGVKYYAWDTKRQKTGVQVRIRISDKVLFNHIIIQTMLMFRKGTYLLPLLDGCENDDSLVIYKKVSNYLSNHRKQLKKWFNLANERIIRMNVEKKVNIPLIDLNCGFYSYRNSYAMMYMSSGGSPIALATLMGRSPNTLGSYVKQLTSENDIISSII